MDVYYTETFESTGKKNILVKVGSKRDQANTHKLDRNDPLLGVYGGIPAAAGTRENIYTYGDIRILDTLMLYSGNYNFTPGVKTLDSRLLALQTKSVQTWFCEYYLPLSIYVCPKGYDVDRYALEHGGLDFEEPFWLKQGYLIVNFQIESIKDGERHLSYTNRENTKNGYCNMWKLEGGVSKKTDGDGYTFPFIDGDYMMYFVDPNKTVNKDYRSGGIY